jgi:hypothetical protein
MLHSVAIQAVGRDCGECQKAEYEQKSFVFYPHSTLLFNSIVISSIYLLQHIAQAYSAPR